MQQDIIVDKGINTGIISIEQQTFKSVVEGLSFFYCDRLGVRRPPPSGEWSVEMQSEMDVAFALPRVKRSRVSGNLQ